MNTGVTVKTIAYKCMLDDSGENQTSTVDGHIPTLPNQTCLSTNLVGTFCVEWKKLLPVVPTV